MLITPRQHQAMILPYLCLLVAAWAVTAGDRWAIVAAVGGGSLVAQTHLSYPVLVAALAVVMVVGQVVTTREPAPARGGPPAVRRRRRAGVPAVDPDRHRPVRRVRQPRARPVRVGRRRPGGSRPGRPDRGRHARVAVHVPAPRIPRVRRRRPLRLGVAVDRLLAGARVRVSGGSRSRSGGAGCATRPASLVAIVAVLAGVLDAALLPRTTFGYTIMNYRWLWATGAFVLMLVSVAVGRWITARHETRPAGRSQREFVGRCAVGVRRSGGRQHPPLGAERRRRPLPRRAAQREDRPRSGRRRARRGRRRRADRDRRLGDVLRAPLHLPDCWSRCRSTTSTSASTTTSRNDDSARDGSATAARRNGCDWSAATRRWHSR